MGRDFTMTDHRRGLVAGGREALKRFERSYKAENPGADHLRLVQKIAAYKPRPEGFADHSARAVSLFLGDKSNVKKTNAQIAEFLCANFPGYSAPPSILTEPLTEIDRRKIRVLLAERGYKIDLDKFNTASKVKGALAAIYSGTTASHCVQPKVTFSADAITVGKKRYPIQNNGKVQRIHVGSAMLNVNGLKALLAPG
jgi:hypothetical protein